MYEPLPPVTDKSIAPVEPPLQRISVSDTESVILQEPVVKLFDEPQGELLFPEGSHIAFTIQ